MAGLRKIKGRYYTNFRLPSGRQKTVSLKTSNKRVAKSRKKRIEHLLGKVKLGEITEQEFEEKIGHRRPDESSITLKRVTNEFIKQYKLTKAESTVTKYQETFATLIETWGKDKDIESLSPSDYNSFLDTLKNTEIYNSKTNQMEKRWNNTSINIKLRDLRRLLNWSIENGYIERIPFKVEQLPVPKQKRMTFSKKQFDRLLEAAEERPFWQNFFVFMVNTGLRRGEVNPSVVKNGYLIVDASSNKNNRERMLKITKPLIKIHEDIKSRMYHKNTYTHNLAKYRDKAGLSKALKLHSLRHTFAYRYTRSHRIFDTMKAMGHTNVKTTKDYADVPDEFIIKELGNWDSKQNNSICLDLAEYK